MNSYYKNDDLSFEPFTREEETRLFKLASEGDIEARNKIITNYLQFAAAEGLKEARGQFDQDEVLSAANEGLIAAVEKFDWKHGNGFACYAGQFIRGRVGHLRRAKIRQSQREVNVGLPGSNTKIFEDKTVDHEGESADWKKFWLPQIEKFLTTLNPKQQRIIQLVIFEGKNYSEAAVDMGIHFTWARSLYLGAIEALKKQVSKVRA